ncbi:MAG TPA: efflux RND transporter periplasmic adaptor subunit [Gemmatimonadota bacterium]|nr:efflux RND transporter periplasmic adaptor subunit [Gemmatimonadota bacterium]
MRIGYGHLGPALLVGATLLACGGAREAAEEEEHGHGGGTAVTLWQDSLEIFYEYPPLVAGAEGEPWVIHVTHLGTYEPAREGTLRLQLTDTAGRTIEAVAEAPAREGIFTPAPAVDAAGTWRVVMEIVTPTRRATIVAPEVRAYASADEIPHEEEEAESGGISFLKEQQWQVPFRTEEARPGGIIAAVPVHAEVVAPAGATALASAPVAGLVQAGGPSPGPGEWVDRGRPLAVLSPVGGDDSFAELRARVDRLEAEVARAERLLAVEAIPERRLDDARRDLSVARAHLQALGGGPGFDYVVRAPIAGEIRSRSVAAGQRVAAGDPLFTIVDPRTVWLEMRVPAAHASRVHLARGATFRVEGGDFLRRVDRLASIGSVIDPASRTLLVRGVVGNSDRALKVGMLAEAYLTLGDRAEGTIVPNAAIQDEDGLAVAYVQTGGESFERRILTLGPTDGEETLVTRGIEPTERVVTVGAYQVRLAAVGGEEIGDHGHPH